MLDPAAEQLFQAQRFTETCSVSASLQPETSHISTDGGRSEGRGLRRSGIWKALADGNFLILSVSRGSSKKVRIFTSFFLFSFSFHSQLRHDGVLYVECAGFLTLNPGDLINKWAPCQIFHGTVHSTITNSLRVIDCHFRFRPRARLRADPGRRGSSAGV